MDQLTVHKAKEVKTLYEELNITVIFNVSYSPELNPIETCFSSVKAVFKRSRLHALAKGEDFDMETGVRKAFKTIKPQLVQGCIKRSMALLRISKGQE